MLCHSHIELGCIADDDHDRRLISLAEENERLLTEKLKVLEESLKVKVASVAGPSAEGKGNAANPDPKRSGHNHNSVTIFLRRVARNQIH